MPAMTQETVATTQVLDIVLDTINRTTNSIVSNVDTIKDHPTYVTKTMIRNDWEKLVGQIEVYIALAVNLGFPSHPASLCSDRDRAHAALKELDTLPTGRRSR